jgi:hypothetical protein
VSIGVRSGIALAAERNQSRDERQLVVRPGRATLLLGVVVFGLTGCGPREDDVILRETFSSSQDGWPSVDDATFSAGYVHGGYQLTVKRAQSSPSGPLLLRHPIGSDARALEIEAVATERTAPVGPHEFGVACSRGNVGYSLSMSPDNGFASARKDLHSGDLSYLKLGGQGQSVSRDHVTLRVICHGATDGMPARVTLSVNGERVIDAADQHGLRSFDGVGLTVYGPSGKTTVIFERLVVRRP